MALIAACLMIFATDAASFTPEAPSRFFEQPPAVGRFLVASEAIRDPRFRKTVIFLLKHDSGGALGVIINRPTAIPLSDVFPGAGPAGDLPAVYFGGPVHPVVFSMLVRSPHERHDSPSVLDDVHLVFGTRRVGESIRDLAPEDAIRVYSGYAGWSPGQLEAEIRRGSWHVAPGDPALIFALDPASVWELLIRQVSGRWI